MIREFYEKYLFKLLLGLSAALGIILRLYAFILYRPLWRDECSLALNIYFGKFIDLWGVLIHVQSAPPIFLTLCKIFNSINPLLPEYFLRIVPLISSFFAIFFFYKLSIKFLNSNLAILLANFAFAVNTQLIYFSHEFKQYSTDTAVVLGCLLYFSELDLMKIDKKQLIINSVIIALLPFLSLPSLFIIAGWVLVNLIKKENAKRLIFVLTPAFLLNLIYYLFVLIPSRSIMLKYYNFLWNNGFLNLKTFLPIIKTNMLFYFSQCKLYIIPLFLLFIGILVMAMRREKTDKLIISSLFFVIIASILKLYPISERVSLYLLPIVLIILFLPLSFFKQNIIKLVNIILICFVLGNFSGYKLTDQNPEAAPYMMQILKSNYKTGEYVMYNDVSDSQFVIYSYIYKFQIPNEKCGRIQLADYGEDWYYNVLNSLPKNNKYWFFYSYDIITKPVIPFLKNWAHKNGTVLKEKDFGKSYLLYLQL